MNSNSIGSLQNLANNTDNNKLQTQNDIFQYTLDFEGISITVQEVTENQPANPTVQNVDSPTTEENVNNSIKKVKTAPDPEKLKQIRENLNKILQTDRSVNGLQGVTYPVSNKKKEHTINNLEKYKTAVRREEKLQQIRTNLNRILQSDSITHNSFPSLENQCTETPGLNNLLSEITDIKKLNAVLSQSNEDDFDETDSCLGEESLSTQTPESSNSNVYECSSSNDSGTTSIDYALTADSATTVTVNLNFDQNDSDIPETPVPSIDMFKSKQKFSTQLAKKISYKIVKLRTEKNKVTETKTATVEVKKEPDPQVDKTSTPNVKIVNSNVGRISVKPASELLPPKLPVVGVQKRSRPFKDSGEKLKVKHAKSELVMCTEVVGNVQRLTVKTMEMINSASCDKDLMTQAQDRKSSLRSRKTKNK